MKLLICLLLSFSAMTAFAQESENGAPDVCKVECECWGQFGGAYDERPTVKIGVVESWGYCPTHVSPEDLLKYHMNKNRIQCNMLGETSASRFLQHCKKNF